MNRFSRLVFASAIVILLAAAAPPARQLAQQRDRIASEGARLSVLLEENARLESRLERLNDPDYLEKVAREQLEMVRPGEIIYVVVTPNDLQPSPQDQGSNKPWFGRAWDWVKRLFT